MVEIRHAIHIRTSPERAYDAFATAEGLDAWFTRGARVDSAVDGRIHFRWRAWGPHRIDAEDGGPILEARRPERFAFQWFYGTTDAPTTVELTFTPAEGGTVVSVRESGHSATSQGMARLIDCATGWGEALALAKCHLEHAAPPPAEPPRRNP